MKIVFIGQKGIGNVAGGVEKHVEALSVRLAKKGCQVRVYSRNNVFVDKKSIYKGVNIISLPTIATKSLDTIVHTFLSIIHIFLYQKDADVIHFQSIGPSSLLFLMRVLKPKTPVIATMHAQCYNHSKWNIIGRTYLRLSERLCCAFAQKIIVISKELQSYVEKRYGKEVVYIPNGSDFDKTKISNFETKWNIEEGEYFLFVGRLIPGKKVDVLMDAYEQVKTDKKLVVVGDGAHTDNHVALLHQKAQQNENIILTGFQDSDTIRTLLKGAFAFVFPSESEGMSLVLLEAMSARTPIIASDIDGNRAILDDDECFFFEVNNVNVLVQTLERALEAQEELKKKQELAYSKFIKNYTWDIVAETTYDIYQELKK